MAGLFPAGSPLAAGESKSTFAGLLEQMVSKLASEHEKELAALRAEVERLRGKEKELDVVPAEVHGTPGQPTVNNLTGVTDGQDRLAQIKQFQPTPLSGAEKEGLTIEIDDINSESAQNRSKRSLFSAGPDPCTFPGQWIDPSGSFFHGVVIEISATDWEPLDPPGELYHGSTYKSEVISATERKLIEVRKDGSLRSFQAALHSKDSMEVVFSNSTLKWTLTRLGTDFSLWPEWADIIERSRAAIAAVDLVLGAPSLTPSTPGTPRAHVSFLSKEMERDNMRAEDCVHRVMNNLTPKLSTRWHILWDAMGFILVSFDILFVPMEAFDPPHSVGWDIFTSLFWTVDLLRSFVVGYDHNGAMIADWRVVALPYVKGFFAIDLTCVTADWLVVSQVSNEISGTGLMRIARTGLKARRIVRILKLGSMKLMSDMAARYVASERRSIFLGMAQLAFAILLVNHVIACLWWWLGSTEDNRNWVDVYDVRDGTLAQRYILCLHWSLCQFTPAGMTVHPTNLNERIFAVCTVLTGMAGMSTLIGNYSALVTRLRMLNSDAFNDRISLRRYLGENKVSAKLTSRVQTYVEISVRQQKRKIEKSQVRYLRLLSAPLKKALQSEIIWPTFKVFPMFKAYKRESQTALGHLCTYAVADKRLGRGDMVFEERTVCKQMLFISSGEFLYSAKQFGEFMLKHGHYCCEAALWVPWIHCGTLEADIDGFVLELDSAKFREISAQFTKVAEFCAAYANDFLSDMSESTTDLPEGYTPLEHVERHTPEHAATRAF